MDRFSLNNNEYLVEQDHSLHSINRNSTLFEQGSLNKQKSAFYQCYLNEEIRSISITNALNQIQPDEKFVFYNLNALNKDQKTLSEIEIKEFNS